MDDNKIDSLLAVLQDNCLSYVKEPKKSLSLVELIRKMPLEREMVSIYGTDIEEAVMFLEDSVKNVYKEATEYHLLLVNMLLLYLTRPIDIGISLDRYDLGMQKLLVGLMIDNLQPAFEKYRFFRYEHSLFMLPRGNKPTKEVNNNDANRKNSESLFSKSDLDRTVNDDWFNKDPNSVESNKNKVETIEDILKDL